MEAAITHRLLGEGDPDPVEILGPDDESPLLLVCEHAGRAIPAALGNLSVEDEVLRSHRGWDIGAEALARGLADRLKAPLILQRYSRLVIDCNRPPGGVQSIPEISDAAAIPGNEAIAEAAQTARIREIFDPLDQAITQAFTPARRACFSIHSYTPSLGGVPRPWHAGFLTRRSMDTAEFLIAAIAACAPDLNLAINQPYQIDEETDWFIPQHAEKQALPHCLIEIRNDEIDHAGSVARWVDLLGGAIADFMRTLT